MTNPCDPCVANEIADGCPMAHSRGTLDLVLTLSADEAWFFKWFVDAACKVHADLVVV